MEPLAVEPLDMNDNHHSHHNLVHDIVVGDDDDEDENENEDIDYDITPLPFHHDEYDTDDHVDADEGINDGDNNGIDGGTLKRFMLRQRQVMDSNTNANPKLNKNNNNGDDDDVEVNSIMDRNLKIEDMRQRVEAQLAALTQGTDFTALRQQVAELRRGHVQNNSNNNNIMYHGTEYAPVVDPRILATTRVAAPTTVQTINTDIVDATMNKTATATSASVSKTSRFQVAHDVGDDGTASAIKLLGNHDDTHDDHGHDEVEVVGVTDSFGKSMKFSNPTSNTKPLKKASAGLTTTAAIATKASTRSATTTTNKPGVTKYVERQTVVDPYGDSGTYTGELRLQKPHGVGEMTYDDGRVYTGGWNHGKWHGKGTALFANGDKFDGTYDMDRRHGFGVYEWKDGRVYEGEFQRDQRHGCGEYRCPDGAVYRGEFAAGHRQGEGTYTFSDGSTYTGEWHSGRYHGVGQCIWKDGRVYKGEWRDGKAHGYGVEKRVDGTIRHEGTWDADVPVRKR